MKNCLIKTKIITKKISADSLILVWSAHWIEACCTYKKPVWQACFGMLMIFLFSHLYSLDPHLSLCPLVYPSDFRKCYVDYDLVWLLRKIISTASVEWRLRVVQSAKPKWPCIDCGCSVYEIEREVLLRSQEYIDYGRPCSLDKVPGVWPMKEITMKAYKALTAFIRDTNLGTVFEIWPFAPCLHHPSISYSTFLFFSFPHPSWRVAS